MLTGWSAVDPPEELDPYHQIHRSSYGLENLEILFFSSAAQSSFRI